MKLFAVTCPHCGGKLEVTSNSKMVTCEYCNGKQLQQTIALMKAADNWEEFDKLFKKAMGEPVQTQLDFTIKE